MGGPAPTAHARASPHGPIMMRRLSPLAFLLPLVPGPAAALPQGGPGKDCSQTSVGTVPLNDLGPGLYQGFEGGLYAGGVNMRPPAHDAAGLAQAAQVVPRDAAGQPDPVNGRIGFLSVGMSNTSQNFMGLRSLAENDPERNPLVVFVNGAQGGFSAEKTTNPDSNYWDNMLASVQAEGLTREQVQVVFFLQENQQSVGVFPEKSQNLADQMAQIMRNVRDEYPNCRLAYCMSRIYGGYGTKPHATEPNAYENAFAVKWLIQAQVDGEPGLNYDPTAGPVEAPWLAWGAYAWADGLIPRSDGLFYECDDMSGDGIHLTMSAALKTGALWSSFLKSDATARGWYLANPPALCGPAAQVEPYGAGASGPNGASQIAASQLPIVPGLEPVRILGFGAPPGAAYSFALGTTPLAVGQTPLFGGWLLVAGPTVHSGVTDANGQAVLDLGPVPASPSICGAEFFLQFGAADPDTPGGFDLTYGLRLRAGH